MPLMVHKISKNHIFKIYIWSCTLRDPCEGGVLTLSRYIFVDIGRIVIKNEIPRDLGLNFSKLQKLLKNLVWAPRSSPSKLGTLPAQDSGCPKREKNHLSSRKALERYCRRCKPLQNHTPGNSDRFSMFVSVSELPKACYLRTGTKTGTSGPGCWSRLGFVRCRRSKGT